MQPGGRRRLAKGRGRHAVRQELWVRPPSAHLHRALNSDKLGSILGSILLPKQGPGLYNPCRNFLSPFGPVRLSFPQLDMHTCRCNSAVMTTTTNDI